MAKSKKYICIRDCYVHEKKWTVGEPLTPGLKPNKHFASEDDFSDALADATRIPITPADDPRSTIKIISDLKEKFGVEVDEKISRKEAFLMWKDLVVKNEKPGEPAPPELTKKITPVKLIEKKFSELTPDEINNLKLKDIQQTILQRFGVEMNIVGARKLDLIKKALKLEEKDQRRIVEC